MSRLFTRSTLAGLLSLALLPVAHAHEYTLGKLQIQHPHSYPVPPVSPVAAGYVAVNNQGKTDQLLSASSPLFKEVQIHQMQQKGGVMQMRQAKQLALPAKKSTVLAEGSTHLMFIGPTGKLPTVGEAIPVTLVFAKAGKVTVDFKIEEKPAMSEEHHHH
jgi:hypothetical protein